MMGSPAGVDLQADIYAKSATVPYDDLPAEYADIHARELRRRRAHERAFAWLGAVLVALVLTCDWWAR